MALDTLKTYTRQIGSNKGKPRLWLEGAILQEHGFTHGATWVLVPDPSPNSLAFVRVDTDEKTHNGMRVRRIAGTAARPIIDVTGRVLEQFAGRAVQIMATANTLIVTKED